MAGQTAHRNTNHKNTIHHNTGYVKYTSAYHVPTGARKKDKKPKKPKSVPGASYRNKPGMARYPRLSS